MFSRFQARQLCRRFDLTAERFTLPKLGDYLKVMPARSAFVNALCAILDNSFTNRGVGVKTFGKFTRNAIAAFKA